jgi:hypothetical protein
VTGISRRARRAGRLSPVGPGRPPEVAGEALGQAAALRLGREIFGPLLTGAGGSARALARGGNAPR